MSGSGAIDRNHIDRTCGFSSRALVDTQRFGELSPGRTVHKSIGVPGVKVSHRRCHRRASRLDRSLGSKMLDDGVIPVLAVLMAQNNMMRGHGHIRISRLQKLA